MRTRATATIIGHAVDDPEFHDSGDTGTSWCAVWVSTTRGEERTEEVHRLMFYGRLAEQVRRHVRRGSAMVVEGRIEYDNERRAEIVAREASFIVDKVTQ